jgi:hypothetical protein
MSKEKIVYTQDTILQCTEFNVQTLQSIPANIINETILLTIFKEQIKKMSYKYKSMAVHSVGGSVQDLVSTLNLRALVAFQDWQKRIEHDGSLDTRNALDVIKFISCRLRTHCIDLARYQRDRIEPAYQMFDYVNPEDTNIDDSMIDKEAETELWKAHLTDTQKHIVNIWKEGTFYYRKDPIKALTKEVARRLSLKENIVIEEIQNIPQL